MKKSYFLLFIVCSLLSAVFLSGCGGGNPGMPGSQGDTGVIIDASITPAYNGKNTSSVDVVQQTCTPATTTTPAKFEYMADHSATLTVNARLLNPNTKFQPGTLTIEKYTIEFRRTTDSIGAPPIETMVRYNTFTITPPAGNAVSTVTISGILLVDLARKAQYYADVTSGQYTTNILNNYTAIYTFEGQDQVGTRFSFVVQTNFQIGSFDNCV